MTENKPIKKMKENSFAESTILTWVAFVVSKALGLLYNVPFYALIGDSDFLYTCAYAIYLLFLDVSTSGIPTGMSMIIGYYQSLGKTKSKEKAYKIGFQAILTLSLVSFLIMQFGAHAIASFYLKNMEGGATVKDLALSIRIVSLALLVVPFLSVKRGYMQGHKFFTVSSASQIIEQVVRIAMVLIGSYLIVKVFNLSSVYAVMFALLASSIGALISNLYVSKNMKSFKSSNETEEMDDELKEDSNNVILKKFLTYCLPITIMALTQNIYTMVDTKLILVGLTHVGYSAAFAQKITSLACQWVPRLAEVMVVISTAMTASIAPHIASSFAKDDIRGVSEKINTALNILITIIIPLGLGIMVFADSFFRVFYGASIEGPQILVISVVLHMALCFTSVLGMALQGIGLGKSVVIIVAISVSINALCDLPLTYLFHAIGIPAYLGTTVSSALAEIIKLVIILWLIARTVNINYDSAKEVIKKVSLPILLMLVTVIVLKAVVSLEVGRISLVIRLVLIAFVGIIVYALSAEKMGLFEIVTGKNLKGLISMFFKKRSSL